MNSRTSPRLARLIQTGAQVLANRLGREPTELELINVRRKAVVVEWAERRAAASVPILNRQPSEIFVELPASDDDRISNRFTVPSDWIQVAPIGEFPHAKAGLVQVLDRDAITAMANTFNEQKKEALVDFDHRSQNPEHKSEAAAWISNLEARNDGLYAKMRWTDEGKKAVEGGTYRFISPVWKREDCVDLGNNRCRPMVFDSAGLTNSNNLPVKPISV